MQATALASLEKSGGPWEYLRIRTLPVRLGLA